MAPYLSSSYFLSLWAFYPSKSTNQGFVQATSDFEAVIETEGQDGYSQYLDAHASASRPDRIVRIEGESFVSTSGEGFEIAEKLHGSEGKSVITPEVGSISWDVNVEEPGLYHVRIRYYPIEGKSSAIERQFSINDKVPFKGADIVLFDRVWGNRDEVIRQDNRGNDLRPRQIEQPSWQLAPLSDRYGYYDEPYSFYFDKGKQKFTLTSLREPMAIDYIELYQDHALKAYEELANEYESGGLEPTGISTF